MPSLQTLSPWKQFKLKWQNCSQCKLCQVRKNIVLARGNVPCDVLFIGEAPGASEDALGKPFIGPAGKLLDQQVEEAARNSGMDLTFCFTNLVCCIPKEGGVKIGEPDKECITACDQRLCEFIKLCNPRLIVCVGDLAEKWAGWEFDGTITKITHPAAILRAEVVRQSLMYTKCVVILENAFRDL